MALTNTAVQKPHSIGARWQTIYSVQPDNSYPTGGWSLKPADLGFAATTDPEFQVVVQDTQGYSALYDYTNLKLKLYSAAGTQVTNATDLSALAPFRVVAQGKFSG